MNNEDDILQYNLDALERGSELGDVMGNLPEGNADLVPLIQLAATVRNLPHPEPLRVRARARKRALLNAAGDTTRPVPPLPARERLSPNGHGPQKVKPRSSLPLIIPMVGVGVLALFMMAFVAMLGLGVWIVAAPHNAQAATLMDVQGQVEVADAGGASWRAVTSGDKVSTGGRIRTGAASQATLVFFEGSRTVVGSNADLVLTRVDGDWGRVLRVVLTQNAGKTSHSVVPLRGKSSQFMVFTPSGAGSVHGTNFNVGVGQQGASRFAVDTGKVLVSNNNSQVFLDAGQALTFLADEALEDPAYQFTLQGELTEKGETVWAVEGTTFQVTLETLITGDPQLDGTVLVEGRILVEGWVADSVEVVEEDGFSGSFTGTLDTIGGEGEAWVVGGQSVLVDDETDVTEGLSEEDPVRVTFQVLEDGSWHALQIELLEEQPEEPTPTPTATPDPEAEPVLVFEPETLEGSACGTDFAQSARLVNNGPEPDDYAGNVELGFQVVQGAEFVNGVTFNPSGWEAIDPGEQAIFGIHVNLDEASWGDAPAGTQVEVRVFVAAEQNQFENHDSNLTVMITNSCDSTATPDETGTATETATGTITETVTATPEASETAQPVGEGDTSCTGADPHPTGQNLALQYGVSYEEIMGWFCNFNFGFGEIDQGYSLSLIYGVPVNEIFAMRTAGMGWGQIKKDLAAGGADSSDPGDNGNPVTIGPDSGGPGNGGSNAGNPNPGNGNGSNNGKKNNKGK